MAKDNQNQNFKEYERAKLEQDNKNSSLKDQERLPDQQNRLKDQENMRK